VFGSVSAGSAKGETVAHYGSGTMTHGEAYHKMLLTKLLVNGKKELCVKMKGYITLNIC